MRRILCLAIGLSGACKGPKESVPVPERQSPQAQVVPTPLGKPAEVLDMGAGLAWPAADRELGVPDDTSAVGQRAFSLVLSFRTDTQTTRLTGQLGANRLWLQSGDEPFAAPAPFELRARADRGGHLLLLDDGKKARTLPPGGLRSFFTDGALDVAPLGTASGVEPVRSTATGRISVQRGKRLGLGENGCLLARTLAEFAQAAPGLFACVQDEYPAKVQYEWLGGDARESMTVTVELGSRGEPFEPRAWPMPPAGTAWAGRPEVRPPPVLLAGVQEKLPAGGESGALTVTNRTNLRRLVTLDGLALAWLGAGESLLLDAVRKGSYQVECRSFWGDERLPTSNAKVPGKVSCGDLPPK